MMMVGSMALVSWSGSAIALTESEAKAQVIAQEKAWSDAVIHHDAAKVASILADAQSVELGGGVLRVRFGSSFHREKLVEPRNRELLIEEVRAVCGRGTRLEIEAGERPATPTTEAQAASPPARFSQGVETILERFDGVILDN